MVHLIKSIGIFLFVLKVININAQFVDDFSDGDFTNNLVWSGNTSLYNINGAGQLQLNATSAGTSYLAMALPLLNLDNLEWNISVRQNYAPSNSNFCKIYLVSNTENLNATSINGYYLRLGRDLAGDVVEFYRQSGIINSSIAGTSTSISAAHNIDIKVKRDAFGEWSIFVKTITDLNFGTAQAIFTDNSYTNLSYFGFQNSVTASNIKNFYIDNIYINSPFDSIAPTISGFTIESGNTIKIDFSERLKLPILGTYGSFSLPSNNIATTTLLGTSLLLEYENTFEATNSLSISGVSDLASNATSLSIINFVYTTNSPPISHAGNNLNYRDITINELMVDINPTPSGLPAVEFIELFNNTNLSINLLGDTLLDGSTKRPFTRNFTIAGGGFGLLVGSENGKNQLRSLFPALNIYTLSGLGLTDGGESLTLKNANGKVIDQINYKSSWYKDADKNDGGYSLEQINPKNPCSGEANWKATIDEKGGTPGFQNSVVSSQIEAPQIKNVITKNAFQLEVVFNQPMDTSSFITSSFNIENGLTAYLPVPYNYKQDTLKLFTSQNLTVGKAYQFTILGIKNCEGVPIENAVFTIGLPRLPTPGEIIINEVMAEPEPQVQLPIAEFIELYNTTNELIDVSNFKIKDATASSNGKIASNAIIQPKGYLTLTSESNASLFAAYGNIAIVSSFPSLNKTGDFVSIIDLNTLTIDQINYKPDWYKSEVKAEGGWSLERINPVENCGGKYNWSSAIDTSGGTPGKVNSIYNIEADSAKPLVINTLIKSKNMIAIVFSEGMKAANLSSAFSIAGKDINSVLLSDQDADTALVNLASPLDAGKAFTIQVQNLYDCSGNKLDYFAQTLGIGRYPKPFEIVINEIMADENPVQALPEAEFIELFNTTTDLIDLGNFKIFDATTIPGKFPSTAVIQPQGYLILCTTTHVNDFKPYGNTLGISSFPSLNSTGDVVDLRNAEGISISKIKYSDGWYRDEIKKDGGWSLERIDPLNPCGTANNWIAAANETFGGTPGKINSNYASNPDNDSPILTQAFATNKDTLLLYFNEPIDSLSASNGTYTISSSTNGIISLIGNDKIYLIVTPSLLANQLYSISISRVKDCVGNFINGSDSKSFYLSEKADSFDVVINEILFNPRTGGSDFVEIYNRSPKSINLSNWYLANVENDINTNFKVITTENSLMPPRSYKVLSVNKENIKNNYPNSVDSNFIEMPSFPAFNDDEGTVVLANQEFKTLDLFHYKDDYHLKLLDNKEGVSLERTNFDLPTNTPENWASAAQNVGFATPGFKNSQQYNTEISDKAFDIMPKIFSPDEDGYFDFTTITFNIKSANNIATVTIFNLEGRIIRRLVRNQNIGNQSFFQWDGTDEAGLKARVGNYLVYIELFNLQGEVKSYKENVVLAAKF